MPTRAKPKTTKEQQDADIKALHDRKIPDAKLNYKYDPCTFCGKATRWRLPNGVPDTEENIKKYAPKHCGTEECSKAYTDKIIAEKKDVANSKV